VGGSIGIVEVVGQGKRLAWVFGLKIGSPRDLRFVLALIGFVWLCFGFVWVCFGFVLGLFFPRSLSVFFS